MQRRMRLRGIAPWAAPVIVFAIFLLFATAADIGIAKLFTGKTGRFAPPHWCLMMYRYGLIPGQLLFLFSTSLALYGYLTNKAPSLRSHSLYISLTLVIGSGFIGHALLKQFWKRPRPKQTVCFGGRYPYCHPFQYFQPKTVHQNTLVNQSSDPRQDLAIQSIEKGPILQPGVKSKVNKGNLRSLPSGHATMGFYFFSLYFVGKRTGRRWAMVVGFGLAFALGLTLSWARMAQGGHYFSDVFASALIMWLTAFFLDRYFQRRGIYPCPILPSNSTNCMKQSSSIQKNMDTPQVFVSS